MFFKMLVKQFVVYINCLHKDRHFFKSLQLKPEKNNVLALS